MANFCGKCGAPLEAGDRFCMQCGELVKVVDEELTVPLKSSAEKKLSKEISDEENQPEKKTGLAARAVHGSNVNPKEMNNNTDDADDVLKQIDAENRQQAKSPDKETSQPKESKKEPDKPKTVPPKKNDTDKAKTAPPKKNNKTIFIIVGIVIGVIAIGALIYCFATGILPPKTTVPISFKINIDDGFTKDSTPIVAKITDKSNKDNVTYAAFTPDGGTNTEVNVPQGQYEITLISPINTDGSIYDMGKTVTINTESENERNVSTSCKRVAANNVTSSQLQSIADALKEASSNGTAAISESAVTKANECLKAKQNEEEQQKKEAEKQRLEQQTYDSIIEQYNNAIAANYTESQFRNADLSMMLCRNFYGSSSSPSRAFGYTLMDIDGDGTRELLIGEIGKTYIYDMYTITNGQAERVFLSYPRSNYKYAGENKILHSGSNSAVSGLEYLYQYNQGLVQIDGAESKGDASMPDDQIKYYIFDNGDWRQTDKSECHNKMQELSKLEIEYEMTLFPASQ